MSVICSLASRRIESVESTVSPVVFASVDLPHRIAPPRILYIHYGRGPVGVVGRSEPPGLVRVVGSPPPWGEVRTVDGLVGTVAPLDGPIGTVDGAMPTVDGDVRTVDAPLGPVATVGP